MERPPVFSLEVLADRALVKDVVKGMLILGGINSNPPPSPFLIFPRGILVAYPTDKTSTDGGCVH